VAGADELTLIAQLGSGGMADAYLALRKGVGGFAKLVVVKRLRPSAEHDLAAMFRDEARLAARMNHPNIVQTFQCEEDQLEMEFLDGQSLHRILRRMKTAQRALDPELAALIVNGLLAGLDYAHELTEFDGTPLNVVHRDVSPQNVFITYSGKIKLIDFGIAKAAQREEVTQFGVVKGKVRFMAPEQALAGVVDRRVDIFAAGIVLWELLTGDRYWGKTKDLDIVRRLKNGDLPPPPNEVNPAVSVALADVCQRALAHDVADRFPTCAEFQNALKQAIAFGYGVGQRLGALVTDLFAEDQKTLRKIVEEAMAKHAAGVAAPLTKVVRSGIHSHSELSVLPTSHTAPPPVEVAVARPAMRPRWLMAAAVSLSVATMFVVLRFPLGLDNRSDSATAGANLPVASVALRGEKGDSGWMPEEEDSEDDPPRRRMIAPPESVPALSGGSMRAPPSQRTDL
jgi:serine/threonine protein kinase